MPTGRTGQSGKGTGHDPGASTVGPDLDGGVGFGGGVGAVVVDWGLAANPEN